MDYQATRHYLLSKPEALEDFPFGPDVAVFKIRGKMFATLAWHEGIARTNLKCDPQEAIALRTVFDAVLPGYHMNKRHWNTVLLNATVPGVEIRRMIDRSFALVVKGLKKPERTALELRYGIAALYP
jgi:predicted DNA-binding protein (MmcQ/YjbR family)